MHWVKWSQRICSGTKLKRAVKCAGLRNRQKNGAFSEDGVQEEAHRSLAFNLGIWSAMPDRGIINDDRVRELDVDLLLTWATVVDFRASLRSSLFPRGCSACRVVCRLSVDHNLCWSFSKTSRDAPGHEL